jgi:hypothetical protein
MNGEKELYQSLLDAGYSRENAEQFLRMARTGDMKEQHRDLLEKREELMHALHACQDSIDCLDYLIFQYERKLYGGKDSCR